MEAWEEALISQSDANHPDLSLTANIPQTSLVSSSSSSLQPSTQPNSIQNLLQAIPCKVCGDKSSGKHYGVLTCEGCKGFFRRSLNPKSQYECSQSKNCGVDRINRNRCQYCRFQSCLRAGMSKRGIKFGRMSKEQKGMIEEEARYHRSQKEVTSNKIETGSSDQGSSNCDQNIPTSSDQFLSSNQNQNGSTNVHNPQSEYIPNGHVYNVAPIDYMNSNHDEDSTVNHENSMDPGYSSMESMVDFSMIRKASADGILPPLDLFMQIAQIFGEN